MPSWNVLRCAEEDRMADALRISPAEARARVDAGRALILDVVSPLAWDQLDVAIAGALRIPPDELNDHLAELPTDRDLIAYCT
jgi:rhodanese-related sulfurtransferase